MKVISESLKQKTLDPYELWAVAQLMPDEGIEDGVRRVEKFLGGKTCTHDWVEIFGSPAVFECKKCGALER